MSSPPEFSETELELIEELVTQYGHDWVQTKIEMRLVDSVLEKIDRYLNG